MSVLHSLTRFRNAQIAVWLVHLCILSSGCGMWWALNAFPPFNEWMSHCPGVLTFSSTIPVGQWGWDVWVSFGAGAPDASECVLGPVLLGKGFWTVCFGVLGHSWSELWPLQPASTIVMYKVSAISLWGEFGPGLLWFPWDPKLVQGSSSPPRPGNTSVSSVVLRKWLFRKE